jgi:hypothetical protein
VSQYLDAVCAGIAVLARVAAATAAVLLLLPQPQLLLLTLQFGGVQCALCTLANTLVLQVKCNHVLNVSSLLYIAIKHQYKEISISSQLLVHSRNQQCIVVLCDVFFIHKCLNAMIAV